MQEKLRPFATNYVMIKVGKLEITSLNLLNAAVSPGSLVCRGDALQPAKERDEAPFWNDSGHRPRRTAATKIEPFRPEFRRFLLQLRMI